MVKIFTEKDCSFILYLDFVKNAIIKIMRSNSLGNTVFVCKDNAFSINIYVLRVIFLKNLLYNYKIRVLYGIKA